MSRLVRELRGERGDALIEGLLALGLVLVVVAFAGQAIAYVHARDVAQAAAQDGASTAADSGLQAGVDRAEAILAAAGGAGGSLHATVNDQDGEVTVTVQGAAPRLFSLPLLLPAVKEAASLPLEQYPADEQTVNAETSAP